MYAEGIKCKDKFCIELKLVTLPIWMTILFGLVQTHQAYEYPSEVYVVHESSTKILFNRYNLFGIFHIAELNTY